MSDSLKKNEVFTVTAALSIIDRIREAELDTEELLRKYAKPAHPGGEKRRLRIKRFWSLTSYVASMVILGGFAAMSFYLTYVRAGDSFFVSCFFGGAGLLTLLMMWDDTAEHFKKPITLAKLRKMAARVGAEPEKTYKYTFVFGENCLIVYTEEGFSTYYYEGCCGIIEGEGGIYNIFELSDGLLVECCGRTYWLPARFVSLETGERLFKRLHSLPGADGDRPMKTIEAAVFPKEAEQTEPPFFAALKDAEPVMEAALRLKPEYDDDCDLDVTRLTLFDHKVTRLALFDNADKTLLIRDNGDDIYLTPSKITRTKRGDYLIDSCASEDYTAAINAVFYEPDSVPDEAFFKELASRTGAKYVDKKNKKK